MDINGLLDGKVHIEGETLPTLREIIEKHFIDSAGGNAALGKMIAVQYVSYIRDFLPRNEPSQEQAKTEAEPAGQTGTADASRNEARPKVNGDAEALLKSFGVPLGEDGRIDVMGAIAGVMSPEGSKTPLGTLFGTVLRGIGDVPKPRS